MINIDYSSYDISTLMEKIEKCPLFSLRIKMIAALPDKYKIKYINEAKDEFTKAKIIKTINSQEMREAYLQEIEDEGNKVVVINSFKDEDLKMKYIDKLSDENSIKLCAIMLKNISNKLKYLEKLHNQNFIYELLSLIPPNLNQDKEITKYIEKQNSERLKSFGISILSNDNLKIRYLSQIKNEFNRVNVINSFESDELKIKYFKQIKDSKARAMIIASLKDEKIKRKILAPKNQKYEQFDFSDDITIGIEIECVGKAALPLLLQKNSPFYNYEKKTENSLDEGVEVTSPILKNKKEDVQSIYYICNLLKECRVKNRFKMCWSYSYRH